MGAQWSSKRLRPNIPDPVNRSCGALLRKGCCLACKGLTSVGLADSLRVTHCLGEGKSNRKGSLKKVPVQ